MAACASCGCLQAEYGIRDGHVTGVQTCALPIFNPLARHPFTVHKHAVGAVQITNLVALVGLFNDRMTAADRGIVNHQLIVRATANGQALSQLVMTNAGAIKLMMNVRQDRTSTRLNSSHVAISYAVLCL